MRSRVEYKTIEEFDEAVAKERAEALKNINLRDTVLGELVLLLWDSPLPTIGFFTASADVTADYTAKDLDEGMALMDNFVLEPVAMVKDSTLDFRPFRKLSKKVVTRFDDGVQGLQITEVSPVRYDVRFDNILIAYTYVAEIMVEIRILIQADVARLKFRPEYKSMRARDRHPARWEVSELPDKYFSEYIKWYADWVNASRDKVPHVTFHDYPEHSTGWKLYQAENQHPDPRKTDKSGQ